MPFSSLTAIDLIPENSLATPGLFNHIFSQLSDNIGTINAGGTPLDILSGSTWASIGLFANSNNSDYIRFRDSSGQRSTYRLGSHAGGTADGLNIFDESGNTMIASFSKQSIRFYQNVVGPVFDVGGALASTLNAATFGSATDSDETRIQAAINAASQQGVARVYLPASMYPYSASSVSFIHSLQMVREGGDWSVYDATAYGASGNGTTDDTSAFVAGMSAISGAGGGTLFMSKGTYLLSYSTVITVGGNGYGTALYPPSNIVVRGTGAQSSTFKAAANFPNNTIMMLLNGVSNVVLRDIGFDGNIANQSLMTSTDNGYSGVVCFSSNSNIEISSCNFTGFTKDCLSAGYPNGTWTDGLLVQGCNFQNWQRGAVTLVGARNVRINSNQFSNSTLGLGTQSHVGAGIWLEPNVATDPLDNISVTGNAFLTVNGGLYIFNAQQTDLFQMTVNGNNFQNCDTGIYGLSAWGVRIIGNTFRACGASSTSVNNHPIYLNGSRWASVIGNIFRDCGSERGDVDLVQAARYVTIADNTFVGSKRECIHVELTATQFGLPVITGNRIETGGLETPNTYDGIKVKCPSGTYGEDGVCMGNLIATSTSAGLKNGIAIEYWQAGILTNNFVTGTGTPFTMLGLYAPGYGYGTWDPISLAPGASDSTTLVVPGSQIADAASYEVIAPYSLQSMTATANCIATNKVGILLYNSSGVTVNLGSGQTWGVKMRKQYG